MKAVIQEGNSDATHGRDKVSPFWVYLAASKHTSVAKVLCIFVNLILDGHVMPTVLRTFRAAWIPKKGNHVGSSENIRPLGIQSVLVRITNKILSKRIADTVAEYNLILRNQQGGMPGLSATLPLNILAGIISNAKKLKLPIYILNHDLRNGFNEIKWESIVFALRRRGLGLLEDIILRGLRNSTVVFEHKDGPICVNVTKALKQGDPLSSLLFVIIMDDLHRMLNGPSFWSPNPASHPDPITTLHSLGYIDDATSIAYCMRDLHQHQKIMQIFTHWHNLPVNVAKASVTGRNPDGSSLSTPFPYYSTTITPVPIHQPFKSLGILFTLSLDWKPQIEKIMAVVYVTSAYIRNPRTSISRAFLHMRTLPSRLTYIFSSIPNTTLLRKTVDRTDSIIFKAFHSRIGGNGNLAASKLASLFRFPLLTEVLNRACVRSAIDLVNSTFFRHFDSDIIHAAKKILETRGKKFLLPPPGSPSTLLDFGVHIPSKQVRGLPNRGFGDLAYQAHLLKANYSKATFYLCPAKKPAHTHTFFSDVKKEGGETQLSLSLRAILFILNETSITPSHLFLSTPYKVVSSTFRKLAHLAVIPTRRITKLAYPILWVNILRAIRQRYPWDTTIGYCPDPKKFSIPSPVVHKTSTLPPYPIDSVLTMVVDVCPRRTRSQLSANFSSSPTSLVQQSSPLVSVAKAERNFKMWSTGPSTSPETDFTRSKVFRFLGEEGFSKFLNAYRTIPHPLKAMGILVATDTLRNISRIRGESTTDCALCTWGTPVSIAHAMSCPALHLMGMEPDKSLADLSTDITGPNAYRKLSPHLENQLQNCPTCNRRFALSEWCLGSERVQILSCTLAHAYEFKARWTVRDFPNPPSTPTSPIEDIANTISHLRQHGNPEDLPIHSPLLEIIANSWSLHLHYDTNLISFSPLFSAWSSSRTMDRAWGAWENDDILSKAGEHCVFACLDYNNTKDFLSIANQIQRSPHRARWVISLDPILPVPDSFQKIVTFENSFRPSQCLSFPTTLPKALYVVENNHARGRIPVIWPSFISSIQNYSRKYGVAISIGTYSGRPPNPSETLYHKRLGLSPTYTNYGNTLSLLRAPAPFYWREHTLLHDPFDEDRQVFINPEVVWSGAYLFGHRHTNIKYRNYDIQTILNKLLTTVYRHISAYLALTRARQR
jgi:hypothetical protein